MEHRRNGHKRSITGSECCAYFVTRLGNELPAAGSCSKVMLGAWDKAALVGGCLLPALTNRHTAVGLEVHLVEEAAAGGRTAQARQALLALLPLKPVVAWWSAAVLPLHTVQEQANMPCRIHPWAGVSCSSRRCIHLSHPSAEPPGHQWNTLS